MASDPLGYLWPKDLLAGLFVVGQFAGIEQTPGRDGYAPGYQVCVDRLRGDGSTWRQTYLFDGYDDSTGERSPIAEALDGIVLGSMVALRVDARNARQSGKVWLKATHAFFLDRVDA